MDTNLTDVAIAQGKRAGTRTGVVARIQESRQQSVDEVRCQNDLNQFQVDNEGEREVKDTYWVPTGLTT